MGRDQTSRLTKHKEEAKDLVEHGRRKQVEWGEDGFNFGRCQLVE